MNKKKAVLKITAEHKCRPRLRGREQQHTKEEEGGREKQEERVGEADEMSAESRTRAAEAFV